MDERAMVHDCKLIVESVRAIGNFANNGDPRLGQRRDQRAAPTNTKAVALILPSR